MRIREAIPTDIPRVAEIKVRNWRDTYAALVPPEALAPFLDEAVQVKQLSRDLAEPSIVFLVAENERSEVIGFAVTHAAADPEPWLESLHVLREHRSGGAGAALVRATAHRLRDKGHRTMRLAVLAGNDRAMRFYQQLGAVNVGREPAGWAGGVQHEVYRWSDLSVLATSGR